MSSTFVRTMAGQHVIAQYYNVGMTSQASLSLSPTSNTQALCELSLVFSLRFYYISHWLGQKVLIFNACFDIAQVGSILYPLELQLYLLWRLQFYRQSGIDGNQRGLGSQYFRQFLLLSMILCSVFEFFWHKVGFQALFSPERVVIIHYFLLFFAGFLSMNILLLCFHTYKKK